MADHANLASAVYHARVSDEPHSAENRREPPAWTNGDLRDPHAAEDKAHRIQRMFDAIAHRYDLNNRLHSFRRDQAWRRRAVRTCRVKTTDVVLDVACGTGDLAIAFGAARAERVIGVDFSQAMLARAADKAAGRPELPLNWIGGDALRLPIAEASVDIVSIAFGLRNVSDPAAAISEFARVLRPGGRLMILEFTTPANPLIRAAYHVYFHHVMPHTASWISRDAARAYRYLPRSVTTFAGSAGITGMMRRAGLQVVSVEPVTFGIATIFLAQRTARNRR